MPWRGQGWSCTVVISEPGVSQQSTDSTELVRLGHVWNEVHMRGNAAVLDSLWAGELAVTVPGMPRMARAEVIGFVRSGRMRFQRYETSDLRVRVCGDAAVVTGRLERTRRLEGEVVVDDWQFTKKMYVRRAGRWRVVACHASARAQ
ncbi:MAG: nuclear transport factor 2 family protein [Gemmatimonadales bacterium]